MKTKQENKERKTNGFSQILPSSLFLIFFLFLQHNNNTIIIRIATIGK